MDSAVAKRWGILQGEARRVGRPLPVLDTLIAATATVHRLTVATRNVRDFASAGVSVFNPWEAATEA